MDCDEKTECTWPRREEHIVKEQTRQGAAIDRIDMRTQRIDKRVAVLWAYASLAGSIAGLVITLIAKMIH